MQKTNIRRYKKENELTIVRTSGENPKCPETTGEK
jgi:hypothetical protein